jgi:hypothetical protein
MGRMGGLDGARNQVFKKKPGFQDSAGNFILGGLRAVVEKPGF